MPMVGIVMGSDSDLKVMSSAAAMLEELGIEYEMRIISAHREPDLLIEWTRTAKDRGIKVMIAGAGMAAALPGMCAALFRCLPEFLLQPLPLTERRTRPFLQRKCWQPGMRSCLQRLRAIPGT